MAIETSVKLKYGDKSINFHLKSKNIIAILTANQAISLKEPFKKLENLLENPINSFSLGQLIKDKKAKKVLIIVNDITRPTPLSSLNKDLTKKLFMEPKEDIEQAIKLIREKYGDGFRSYIIPSGE